MNQYLVLVEMDRCSIPFTVEAKTKAEAMRIVSSYCEDEGYYGSGMQVVELMKNIGIIEL